jgi:hypothetical protein
MWTLIVRALAEVLAALASSWRSARALKANGALQAQLEGLEDVNQRAQRADAAARRSRADPELLRDDGYRRD